MHEGNKNHPKETVKRGLRKSIQESEKKGEQKEPVERKSSRPNDCPKIMRPKFKEVI
jgi:hypothetical protein